ncbi:hypothetical protein HDU67_006263 [Dinochytrium kinnereticum]|nr:hypothetical protein HDU67_006263 [Dinochytrium kinnereticum]
MSASQVPALEDEGKASDAVEDEVVEELVSKEAAANTDDPSHEEEKEEEQEFVETAMAEPSAPDRIPVEEDVDKEPSAGGEDHLFHDEEEQEVTETDAAVFPPADEFSVEVTELQEPLAEANGQDQVEEQQAEEEQGDAQTGQEAPTATEEEPPADLKVSDSVLNEAEALSEVPPVKEEATGGVEEAEEPVNADLETDTFGDKEEVGAIQIPVDEEETTTRNGVLEVQVINITECEVEESETQQPRPQSATSLSRQNSFDVDGEVKRRQSEDASNFIPVISIDETAGGDQNANVGANGESVAIRRLSKSASSNSISRSSSNSNISSVQGGKRRLSLTGKNPSSMKKSSTDLSPALKADISDKTTTLISADYGTSFAGFTASANVAEGTLIAHLPTTIHFAEKPSVASPHVMEPFRRNTLMGRRMDASQATAVVQESLLTPAQAVAAKAPSGTSGVLVPRTVDSAREFLARRLRARKLDNLANIAFACIRQLKKERSSVTQQDAPDFTSRLEEFRKQDMEGEEATSAEIAPAPVTRVEVSNRRLPERRPMSAISMKSKTSAYDSGLPILKTYIEDAEQRSREEMEAMLLQNDSRKPRRTLPQRPWTMTSLIPVPVEPKTRKVEIVSVSLADLTHDEKKSTAAENVASKPRKSNTKQSKKKKSTAPPDGKSRKLTVLTKKGMKLEVKADKFVLGDDMTGVLAIKHNSLRGPFDAAEPQKGPNLPGLESRPITSLLKKRFNEWDCPVRRRPDDYFSQYSQPLPITRDSNVPQKQPTKRYHLLRELRLRREYLLQEVYLGQTAVSPKQFLKQINSMEKAVQGLVGGKYHQTLAPTFNTHAPCHELFNELGQIHWKERALSRKNEKAVATEEEPNAIMSHAKEHGPVPPKVKRSPYAIPPSYLKMRRANRLVSHEHDAGAMNQRGREHIDHLELGPTNAWRSKAQEEVLVGL